MPLEGTISADAGRITRLLRGLTAPRREHHPEMRRAWYEVLGIYGRFIRARFLAASVGRGVWEALSPSTISGRLSRGLGKAILGSPLGGRLRGEGGRLQQPLGGAAVPILIDSGRLLRSLSRSGGEHIEEYLSDGVRFGTSVPYAGFHQSGTSRMPARMILVPPDQATTMEIGRTILNGLARMAAANN